MPFSSPILFTGLSNSTISISGVQIVAGDSLEIVAEGVARVETGVMEEYSIFWCKDTWNHPASLPQDAHLSWTTTNNSNAIVSTLRLTNVTEEMAGMYFCVVAYAGAAPSSWYESPLWCNVYITSTPVPPAPKVPNALPAWSFVCKPYGTALNNSPEVLADFTRCLVLDLNLNTAHPGFGYPITCTLQNTSPCAGNAQLPAGLFAGTVDGYIAQLFSPNAVGLGAPIRRIGFPVAAGSNTSTINITLTEEEDFLPLDDVLLGLQVRVEYADGTTAESTVVSNTVDSVTLSTALTVAPAVGDVVLISPMDCGILFGERRYPYPSNIFAMLLDVENRQGQAQPVTVGLYKADGGGNVVNLNDGPAVRITTTDARRTACAGKVSLPRVASKSLEPMLSFVPRAAGTLQISGLGIVEDARTGGR